MSQDLKSLIDPFDPVTILSHSKRSIVAVVKNTQESASHPYEVLKVGPIQNLRSEAECLSECRHSSIVQLLSSHKTDSVQYLHLEKLEGTSLVEYVDEEPIHEKEARVIIKQIVSALIYLHEKKWAHCDIKPDNIVYDRHSKVCKLVDFEFALKFEDKRVYRKNLVGTLDYCSPEVKFGFYQGPELDIWALGVTLFVMLTRTFPFQRSREALQHKFGKHELKVLNDAKISKSCQQLLLQMLNPDGQTRITAKKILKHSWLSSVFSILPVASLSTFLWPPSRLSQQKGGIRVSNSYPRNNKTQAHSSSTTII